MENVEYTVKGDVLTITINLKHRGKVSDKGNARVASTLGNHQVPGTSITLGLNAYTAA